MSVVTSEYTECLFSPSNCLRTSIGCCLRCVFLYPLRCIMTWLTSFSWASYSRLSNLGSLVALVMGEICLVWGNSPCTRVSSKYSSKFSFMGVRILWYILCMLVWYLKNFITYGLTPFPTSPQYSIYTVFHLKTLQNCKKMINSSKQPVLYHLSGKQKRRRKSIWTPFRHFIVLWIRMIGSKCHLVWDYNSDQLYG